MPRRFHGLTDTARASSGGTVNCRAGYVRYVGWLARLLEEITNGDRFGEAVDDRHLGQRWSARITAASVSIFVAPLWRAARLDFAQAKQGACDAQVIDGLLQRDR